ncbi:cysteine--tRNA ligase [Candidatus Nanosyncoccus alces]|uniref:Cysteine--tRNA ligase n=1 Tax=Candidatus Nanosyncoccus alces TaxID=2171997 RepID=A0ABY0FMF0_9BACT|nr:cysteine--tRNA ligase [Candidatus Nanosyncoccus alces]RYC74454.1 Cysteine--tRNA ligase [Candidatus Nanosyncoccus alces]
MLRLYNTLARKVEDFKPLGEVVKIYTCGPTVYSFPHIGNYAAYTYWDLLVRTLKADGYKVKRVLNLTDVGHLVSDGDEGEDKLEKGAAREGKSPFEVADFYIDVYMENYAKMEFLPADVLARATDYIEADERAVDEMTAHGYTYETTDGIYFDTAKFPQYADFARLNLAGLQAGARVGFSTEKHNVSDFAVWKFIQPGEKHAMRWNYLGRPGYPGWHLECSTIIHETLGEPIDIHTGGVDHIPVHHTNEIAQTYAMTGKDLARYWLHCDFVTVNGQKISKSLGNTYTLDDLADKGFSAMDYKMWLLSGHYQGTRNFTFDSLTAAKNRRLNWRNRIALCYQVSEEQRQKLSEELHFAEILAAVNSNLNSAEAFALIDNLDLTLADWQRIDELFGLRLIADTPDISTEQYALIEERAAARTARDFAKSDDLRDLLKEQGIALDDAPNGTIWSYLE